MLRRLSTLTLLGSTLVAGGLDATPERAISRIMERRQELGLSALHTFEARRTHSDELGQTHTRLQQRYNGIRVWGGEAIVHIEANGQERPLTRALHAGINLNVQASLSAQEALAIVHQALAPKGPYTAQPTTELVIFPETVEIVRHSRTHVLDEDLNAEDVTREVVRHTLAYHVHAELINGTEETRSQDYLINAHTGAILKTWSTLHTAAATGTGTSQWYGSVTLNTNSTASGFELRDMTRGTGGTYGNNITTNMNNGTSGNGSIFTDADNAWGDGAQYNGTAGMSANAQTAAVDAHRGLQATWDFYKNVLGRNGIDNTGKATFSRMHYSTQYDNAFWQDSCFCMTYGDGATGGSVGEADLDTAAHEMTHGVCAATANLTYSGESGGLNESNSDIFGTCVEFYVLGGGGVGSVVPDATGTGTITANYNLFENSWGHPGTALRYMYKPSKDGGSKDAWYSGIGSIDVHYSSGPMNRAFYFMARGASNVSTSDFYSSYLPAGMTGIGNDHSARIWYRALTTYLTASSNYAAARTAAISSAKDLYGAGSAEEQAVWNAFAAINVGAKWAGTANTVTAAITTPSANVTIASGTTQSFVGTATDSASGVTWTYAWTFGDGGTASTASASHLYTNTGTANVSYTATFRATDNTGAFGTATRTITVQPAPVVPTAPVITSQPANQTVTAGSTATFSVTASGTAPFTYQWRKNGTAISGATTASYTTPVTATTDSGATFSVVVTNSVGSTTSSNATLTVNPIVVGTYTEVEANNTIATANAVGSSYTAIRGNLTVATDQDNFALTLAAGQKLTLNMTGPTGVDWDLKLKNAAGTALASSTGSTATETVTYTNTGTTALTVYPNVFVYSGVSATPYNLALTYVTPIPGVTYNEVEANNSIAAANTVSDTATKIVGYIGSSTDNDFFKLNVGAGKTLKVVMTGPTGTTYDYDLYFYNAAGTQLASSTGATTSETASYANTGTSATVVYVAVKRYKGSSTTTPYNLVITR